MLCMFMYNTHSIDQQGTKAMTKCDQSDRQTQIVQERDRKHNNKLAVSSVSIMGCLPVLHVSH